MKRKNLTRSWLVLALVAAFSASADAGVVEWDITTQNSDASQTSTFTAAGIEPNVVISNDGIPTPSGGVGGWLFRDFHVGLTDFAGALAANSTLSFTVDPVDGFEVELTDLAFRVAVRNPQSYGFGLFSDGSLLGSTTITTTTVGDSAVGVITLTSPLEFTDPTDFKLALTQEQDESFFVYGFESGDDGDGGNQIAIELNGSAEQQQGGVIPTPASAALLAPAMLALIRRRR